MKNILCYGDSVSWGIIPGTRQRHPYDRRWTGILQHKLGAQVRVIEECLNGRTTAWDDPFRLKRNGKEMLLALLQSHAPLDLVVIFLGTNDLQAMYGVGSYESALGAAALVDIVQGARPEPMQVAPAVLLVAPPRIVNPRGAMAETFRGAEEKSLAFSRWYGSVAEERGCFFLDASELVHPSEVDGVHLDESQHRLFAEAMHAKVLQVLELLATR